MPWDSLPEHIDTPEEWHGTDWDTKAQRWMLKIKGWFAYGHRSKHWWAKWRIVPKDLLNIHATRREIYDTKIGHTAMSYGYTSVIQYWERWHLLIQWPFHISFHIYWKKSTVPKKPNKRDYGITEIFYFRAGARFDNDGVYWFPSLFIGGDWN